MAQIEHLRTMIDNHRQRLEKLKERQALQGIETPPDVLIEIDKIEVELHKLEAQLEEALAAEVSADRKAGATEPPVKPAKPATGGRSTISQTFGGPRKSRRGPKERVLVVDDHPTWCDMLAEILLENEYDVTNAASYQEALTIIQNQAAPFHAAVIDLNLNYAGKAKANEDGLRLAAELKQHSPATPIIILTGYATPRTATIAFRDLEVFDYVEKFSADGKIFDHVAFQETIRQAVAEAKIN
jgi:CheY-like chemotaxis protein